MSDTPVYGQVFPGTMTTVCALCVCVCEQVFKQPWPGMMRTVYGNHERFESTYFKKFPGYYTTGDGKLHCYRPSL